IATVEDETVALVVYEGGKAGLCDRWMAQQCNMPIQRLKNPQALIDDKWDLNEFRRLLQERAKIEEHGLRRLDNIMNIAASGLTVSEVEGILYRANRELVRCGRKPIAAIFWDYIQLTPVKNPSENREQNVNQVGLQLLQLSQRMNLPVIALTQLPNKEA